MPPRRPADGSKTVGHPDYCARVKAGMQKMAAAAASTAPPPKSKIHYASGRPWSWNRSGGGWRWMDSAAAATAAGPPAQLYSDVDKIIAANIELKEKLAAALKGQAGAADDLEDNDDDDGVDISMEADVPTKEDIAAKKKKLASLQSLLADDADEASAAILRQHEAQLAEMVSALARARPLGEQRQAKVRALKEKRRSYEHYESKRIPGNVSKIAEMEDALALIKQKQAVDLAWFDELRGQIAELEREVQLLDEAASGSSVSAAAPLTMVGPSSFLDESIVHAALGVAQASLRDVPGGLEVLEVLRAGLNGAVLPTPTSTSSPPPAPSPCAAEAPGAAPAAAAAEPAESVVSSIDGLADLSDIEDYDKLEGLLGSTAQAQRTRDEELLRAKELLRQRALAEAAERDAQLNRDAAALDEAAARSAAVSSAREAAIKLRMAGCESLPLHHGKKHKEAAA